MSMSVDVLLFDWDIIVDQIVNHDCDDRDAVEEVLLLYGEKICDKYVIVINEHLVEDGFSLVCNAIDSLFDVDNIFDVIYDLEFDYICGDYPDDDQEVLLKLEERINGDKHEK